MAPNATLVLAAVTGVLAVVFLIAFLVSRRSRSAIAAGEISGTAIVGGVHGSVTQVNASRTEKIARSAPAGNRLALVLGILASLMAIASGALGIWGFWLQAGPP